MDERSDQDLLREYAGHSSDEAFSALVKRHTALVFGAAVRKLADPSAAEEITQQVFVALAKKAPFLCHHQNLSAWLHQTALLECRQRLRAELRRRRREEIAMQTHLSDQIAQPPALAQELDDALLELSERDRQPLLLRFLESLSLREVASALGIREDAAQKRVAKSLSLLERTMRKRGRDIGSAALAAALAESAQAAPAYLAASCAGAALGVGGSATALQIAFGKFMALTKTKTSIACLLAAAAPLLLQTQQLEAARMEQAETATSLAHYESKAAIFEETTRRLNRELEIAEADRQALNAFARQKQSAPGNPRTVPNPNLYRWSHASPYVRLPKALLDEVRLTSIQAAPEIMARYGLSPDDLPVNRTEILDESGKLSDALTEALGFDEPERASVTGSLKHFVSQFEALAAQNTTFTNVMPPGIGFQVSKDEQLYTLRIREFPTEGQELQRQLVAELEGAIGSERTKILMRQSQNAFVQEFLDFGANERWLTATPLTNGLFTIGRSQTSQGNSVYGSVRTAVANAVPAELRARMPQSLFENHE